MESDSRCGSSNTGTKLESSTNDLSSTGSLTKDLLMEASTLVACRRAVEVSLSSIQDRVHDAQIADKFGKKMKEVVRLKTELLALNAKAEVDLLETIQKMDACEKIRFIFKLVNVDRSKDITAIELAHVLQLIRCEESTCSTDAIQVAELTIAANGTDDRLNFREFYNFIESMGSFLEKTMDEIAYFLIMEITSLYSYKFIMDEVLDLSKESHEKVANHLRVESASDTNKLSQTERARLYIFFQLLDSMSPCDGEMCVKFCFIVEAMIPISKYMDKNFRAILLAGADHDRVNGKLSVTDFLELFETVVAASPLDVTLDYIVDIMTAHLCRGTQISPFHESLNCAFDNLSFASIEYSSSQHESGSLTIPGIQELSLEDKNRIHQLFKLWDIDHDGELEGSELFLGLRRFHRTKDCDETMLETLSMMKKAHQDDFGNFTNLTVEHFESIMVDFAGKIGVELCEMIDFMYMETVVTDNHKSEPKHKKDLEYMRSHSMQFVEKLSINNLSWSGIINSLAEEKLSK